MLTAIHPLRAVTGQGEAFIVFWRQGNGDNAITAPPFRKLELYHAGRANLFFWLCAAVFLAQKGTLENEFRGSPRPHNLIPSRGKYSQRRDQCGIFVCHRGGAKKPLPLLPGG